MNLQKNFSNNMNVIHGSHSKTLTEFAEELCISRSSLQDILRGNCNPRIDTVEQIARQLGMDPLDLLSYPDSGKLAPIYGLSELSEEDSVELAAHFYAIVRILVKRAEQSND
ncbi:MAG: helix-turn-helix transcriptional regulator [Firmicutes bacterium]|nr:helix-turn-helix transcriptional regulator [Bacillota bacterium]